MTKKASDAMTPEEVGKWREEQYYKVFDRAAAGAMKGSPSWGMVYALMSAASAIGEVARVMNRPPMVFMADGHGMPVPGEVPPSKAN
jgi:hypothetical protein